MSDDKLMKVFSKSGMLTVAQLMEKTDLAESTVRTNIKRLLDEEKIERVGDGTPAKFAASPTDMELPLPEGAAQPKKEKASSSGEIGKRKPEALARDQKVLQMIEDAGGRTTRDMAEELDIKPGLIYICLWRLSAAGVVVKKASGTRSPLWVRV